MSSLFDQMFQFQFQSKEHEDEIEDEETMMSSSTPNSSKVASTTTSPSATAGLQSFGNVLASNYHPMMMMKMMMLNMEQQQQQPLMPQIKLPQGELMLPSPQQQQQHPTQANIVIDTPMTATKPKARRTAASRRANRKRTTSSSLGEPQSQGSDNEKNGNDAQEQQSPVMPKSENPMYRCHLCSYTGNHKQQFNNHMNTHFDHGCPHCDYTSRTEGRLKRHIRDFHSETPPETWSGNGILPEELLNGDIDPADLSDDELTPGGTGPNPARNRKYRCKQCGYVAIEKRDFWEHTRLHIKTDKMLACPKCNFVTEYKHHLEYHLRNHLGSKPFRCGKCNYSCVNKSMLNSHMKSHSNIYQYRCEDCTYATKYCHSLKLHLRKYEHKPATVLNLDGTPNPYPIIDVYGTRRGPRPKKGPRMGPRGKTILSPLKPTAPKAATTTHQPIVAEPNAEPIAKVEPQEANNQSVDNDAAMEKPMETAAAAVDASPSTVTKKVSSSASSSSSSISSAKAASSMNLSINRCNNCPYQTESKAEFSAHMLDHVRNEKLTLLHEKLQKMNATAATPQTKKTAEETSMVVNKEMEEEEEEENTFDHVDIHSPKEERSTLSPMSDISSARHFSPQQRLQHLWTNMPPTHMENIGHGPQVPQMPTPLPGYDFLSTLGNFNGNHKFPAADYNPLAMEMNSARLVGKPLDLSKPSPPPPPPPPASMPTTSSAFPAPLLGGTPFGPLPLPINNIPVHLLGNPAMLQLFLSNLFMSANHNTKEQQQMCPNEEVNASQHEESFNKGGDHTHMSQKTNVMFGQVMDEDEDEEEEEGNKITTRSDSGTSNSADEEDEEEEEVISSEDEVMLAKPTFSHQLPPTPIKSPESMVFDFPPLPMTSTSGLEQPMTPMTALTNVAGLPTTLRQPEMLSSPLTNMMSLFAQYLQTNPGQTPEESVAAFNLMQKMYNATSLVQEVMAEMEAKTLKAFQK